MLSELNEERHKREELEERLASMEENEKNQSEKIKELINDLLLLSKVLTHCVHALQGFTCNE